ncbi:MAG: TetR family transcriptional regulator [Acidobacteria bacterium]|nr:TetR family transcriptional regulator [Acidobacteriota bacterium]
MRAFVEPAFRMPLDSTTSVTELAKLMGRVYLADSAAHREIIASEVRTRLSQFLESARAALPGIPAEEVMWRFFFSIGAMIHTLAASKNLEFISHGICKASDTEKILEKLICYTVAGMRAPLPHSIQQSGKQQTGRSKVLARTSGKAGKVKSHAASQGR